MALDPREQAVLDFVEGSEFRRQLAKRVADEVVAEYGPDFLATGTVDGDAILADLADRIGTLIEQAVQDGLDHMEAIGFAPANYDELVASLPDYAGQQIQTLVDRAAGLLENAHIEAQNTVATMPELTDVTAAATEEALMSQARSVLRSTAADMVSTAERSAADYAVADAADSGTELFAWETRMDNDVCDDDFDNSCAPRHGWNLSLDEWDQVGQPGDQNLICSMYAKGGGSNCRCVLVPGSETEPLPGPYDVSAATKAGRDAANAVEL